MAIEKDPAVSVTMSLRQSHVDKIKTIRKKNPKRYRSEASVIQHIIDSYFQKTRRIYINYMAYPIILMVLMLFSSISTVNLNKILIGQGFYFNELYLLQNIFLVLGFFWLSITGVSFYLAYSKLKSET